MFLQLQQQIHSQETSMLQRLREHREDHLTILQEGSEERTRLHKLKIDKSDSELEYLKTYISALEKKAEDEVQYR